jgi:hypothetical protein
MGFSSTDFLVRDDTMISDLPRHDRVNRLSGALLLVLVGIAGVASGEVSVTTYQYDVSRDGQNSQETVLTPANVNSTQFGKLFSVAVDGYVYAQPLYLANISIGGGTHNVLYVATEHDSVYAFDADSGALYWQVSLIPSGGRTVVGSTDIGQGCNDIVPEIGITGTPVIDPGTGTLYVIAKSVVAGQGYQYLHALNVATGTESFGGPVSIVGSVAGTDSYDPTSPIVTFNALNQNQRAALLLEGSHVVIAWAAHCDYDPWHGWVMSYSASTLTQEAIFNTTPNSSRGGIWMSGAGLAADGNGSIYFSTGNGTWDGTQSFGDSVVKLGPPQSGSFAVQDYFTPYNQLDFSQNDIDVSSSGLLLLPPLPSPSNVHLLATDSKIGTIYLLNTSNLGGYCGNLTPACTNSDPQIVQEVIGATTGIWGAPAYWNGNLYWAGTNDTLKAFAFNTTTGALSSAPTSETSEVFQFAAPSPTVSANGNTNGILWAVDGSARDSSCTNGSSCLGLFAYDATNLQNLLYNSMQAANNRDSPGSAVKFAVPVVANGKVYVGAQYQVTAFGELGLTAATPTISPAGGSYATAQSVTIADSTASAAIYFTLDGSIPTTNSPVYSQPIMVADTTTINAVAAATGLSVSPLASATFTIGTGVPASAPSASPPPGTYSSAVSIALSDSTIGASIFYTTDGSVPTTSSSTYTSPILVSATTTVNAIGVASGYSDSTVTSGLYTIDANPSVTPVSIGLAGVATVAAIVADGTPPANGGIDYAGNAYSATLLGSSLTWEGSTFVFAAPGANSGVLGGTTIALPTGNFKAINLLATGVNGGQPNQGFMLTYTDGSTTTITQSISDWLVAKNYPGESIVLSMPYRITSSGAEQNVTTNLYGYRLTSDGTKVLKSLTLPNNPNLVVLAIDLVPAIAAASPAATPNAGTYATAQSVTLSDTTAGAQIYFTLDGTPPSTSSSLYAGAISVSSSTTIEAIATATGFGTSPVLSASYSIVAATPGFSPLAGSYATAQTLTLSDTTPGAQIFYTTDGSTPTSASTRYTTPFTIASSATVRAIAVAGGFVNSAIASATYNIGSAGSPVTATPSLTPAPGTYSTAQTVTLSDSTPGASIFYTTDGSTPTVASFLYNLPITIDVSETIEVLAVASGYQNSLVIGGTYTIRSIGAPAAAAPQFSPAGGTFDHAPTVQITDMTSGSVIHYTLDGSAPTTASPVYSAPIAVASTTTIKAIASAVNYKTSAVTSATYTIDLPAATTPTFSPAPGTYSTPQTVTIIDSTPGAVIHYTTDGTAPTTSSPVYTAALQISSTTTLSAIALASGYSSSSVAVGAYAETPISNASHGGGALDWSTLLSLVVLVVCRRYRCAV